MRKSACFAYLIAVFFGLLLITLALPAGAANSAASKKLKLALNWKPEPQFGGFYAADLNGHFKKNGLDVEIVVGGSGTPTVQMVAAKTVDYAIVSADEVILNRARGGDVVALFAAYQTNPQGIMVHEGRGFKTLQDVFQADGKLAMQRGLPYATYLLKKFSPIKAPARVKVVPYQGGISNFLADPKMSQQCFVTAEPIAAKKAGAKIQTFLVADSGYNPYTTVVVTRGDVIEKKPKEVEAMVKAVRSGWQDYLSDPSKTNELMRKLNPSMDAETFTASAEAQRSLIETAETKKNGLGVMSAERWKTLNDQLVEIGLLKKSLDSKATFKNH